MTEHQFHLPDMSCGHCEAAIAAALRAFDGGVELEFDREARRVRVRSSSRDREALAAALAEAGYTPALA